MIARKNYTIALMVHVIFVRETIIPRNDHKRKIFVDFFNSYVTLVRRRVEWTTSGSWCLCWMDRRIPNYRPSTTRGSCTTSTSPSSKQYVFYIHRIEFKASASIDGQAQCKQYHKVHLHRVQVEVRLIQVNHKDTIALFPNV